MRAAYIRRLDVATNNDTATRLSRLVSRVREIRTQFWDGIETTGRFFMGEADVQKALVKLVRILDAHGISYAIIGAMALNEFGYRRATVGVDVLLTPSGLAELKKNVFGCGYVEKYPGRRSLRDPGHGVDIDIVLAGTFVNDLDASVRDKYLELWHAVQDVPPE